jgi:hypothetical protein
MVRRRQGLIASSILKVSVVGNATDTAIYLLAWRLFLDKFRNDHSQGLFGYQILVVRLSISGKATPTGFLSSENTVMEVCRVG